MAVKCILLWALAFILPDTPLSGARVLADKIRKAAASGLRPEWGDVEQVTTSSVVTEAVARRDFDSEDIVTDLINRAEAGLQETQEARREQRYFTGNRRGLASPIEGKDVFTGNRDHGTTDVLRKYRLSEKRAGIGVSISRLTGQKYWNALNRKTMEELSEILAIAQDDEDVRVLILTGAGDKAFVAGCADINELAMQTPVGGKQTALFGQGVAASDWKANRETFHRGNQWLLLLAAVAKSRWRVRFALPAKQRRWGSLK